MMNAALNIFNCQIQNLEKPFKVNRLFDANNLNNTLMNIYADYSMKTCEEWSTYIKIGNPEPCRFCQWWCEVWRPRPVEPKYRAVPEYDNLVNPDLQFIAFLEKEFPPPINARFIFKQKGWYAAFMSLLSEMEYIDEDVYTAKISRVHDRINSFMSDNQNFESSTAKTSSRNAFIEKYHSYNNRVFRKYELEMTYSRELDRVCIDHFNTWYNNLKNCVKRQKISDDEEIKHIQINKAVIKSKSNKKVKKDTGIKVDDVVEIVESQPEKIKVVYNRPIEILKYPIINFNKVIEIQPNKIVEIVDNHNQLNKYVNVVKDTINKQPNELNKYVKSPLKQPNEIQKQIIPNVTNEIQKQIIPTVTNEIQKQIIPNVTTEIQKQIIPNVTNEIKTQIIHDDKNLPKKRKPIKFEDVELAKVNVYITMGNAHPELVMKNQTYMPNNNIKYDFEYNNITVDVVSIDTLQLLLKKNAMRLVYDPSNLKLYTLRDLFEKKIEVGYLLLNPISSIQLNVIKVKIIEIYNLQKLLEETPFENVNKKETKNEKQLVNKEEPKNKIIHEIIHESINVKRIKEYVSGEETIQETTALQHNIIEEIESVEKNINEEEAQYEEEVQYDQQEVQYEEEVQYDQQEESIEESIEAYNLLQLNKAEKKRVEEEYNKQKNQELEDEIKDYEELETFEKKIDEEQVQYNEMIQEKQYIKEWENGIDNEVYESQQQYNQIYEDTIKETESSEKNTNVEELDQITEEDNIKFAEWLNATQFKSNEINELNDIELEKVDIYIITGTSHMLMTNDDTYLYSDDTNYLFKYNDKEVEVPSIVLLQDESENNNVYLLNNPSDKFLHLKQVLLDKQTELLYLMLDVVSGSRLNFIKTKVIEIYNAQLDLERVFQYVPSNDEIIFEEVLNENSNIGKSTNNSLQGWELVAQRALEFGKRLQVCQGDGACMFRSFAVADHNIGDENQNSTVRQNAVSQVLKNLTNPDDLFAFTGGEANDEESYRDWMGKNNEWGTDTELQGLSDYYDCVIMIVTSYDQKWAIKKIPKNRRIEDYEKKNWVWVGYVPGHYNALVDI
jgi:hypothetical protein